MKKKLFVLTITIAILGSLKAQENEFYLGTGYLFPHSPENKGTAVIVQDPRVNKLLKKSIEKNKASGKMIGYRVQIYLSSEPRKARHEAEAMQKKFDKKYSDVDSYLKYESPFFKVQVGDFRTKHDALRFKKSLPFEFQNSYIVRTEIEFPKLTD